MLRAPVVSVVAGLLRGLGLAVALSGLAACASLVPPVDTDEVASFADELSGKLASNEEEIAGDITMNDAVRLAIRRNHTIVARRLEVALAKAKIEVENGAMLPDLMVDVAYDHRDRLHMSRSNLNSTYSTSAEDDGVTKQITLGWNILDFGLSYVRSRQAADRAYQKEEAYRQAAHQIAEETCRAFWRTVALRLLAPRMTQLETEVREALRLAEAAARDSQLDPMEPISLQRDLLDAQRQLSDLLVGLAGAEDELRELIGQPPGRDLRLDGSIELRAQSLLTATASDDVVTALRLRPEIRQHMYNLRINEDEVRAAVLSVLPGIDLTRSYNSDANPFLLHGHWVSWGVSLASNLMRLARLGNDLDVIESDRRLERQLALATAAAIVVQVHVARAKVAMHRYAYRLADQSATVQRRLLAQTRAAVTAGKTGKQRLVLAKLETALSDVRAILALAELQSALAVYASSRGDTVPDEEMPGQGNGSRTPSVPEPQSRQGSVSL
ncbi:MAG: TolC family protein [Hyphomicrobiaceae bacterium]